MREMVAATSCNEQFFKDGYDLHKEYQRPYEYYLRHSPRAYVADLTQLDDVSILEQIRENYKRNHHKQGRIRYNTITELGQITYNYKYCIIQNQERCFAENV